MRWCKPKLKGTLPLAHGQASCVVGLKIIFFGWKYVSQPLHDLYLLDCSKPVFRCIVLRKCDSSIGRVCASFSYVNGRLLLFGGYHVHLEERNELFVFEGPSCRPVWLKIHPN